MIFAVQNLESVWQIIRDRTKVGSQHPSFLSFNLERLVIEKLQAEAPEKATKVNVQLM